MVGACGAAASPPTEPDQGELPAKLHPLEAELQVPVAEGGVDVGGGLPLPAPGPRVPEHDRARSVPVGDHPFELAVLDGVVLDVDRVAALLGVEGRTLRNRPGEQHPAMLEAEIEVEAGGAVHLHAEAPARGEPVPARKSSRPGRPAGRGRLLAAARFRGPAEVAFAAVLVEGHRPAQPSGDVAAAWR